MKFLVVDALAGVQTFARQLLQSRGFAADSILCCADTEAALAQGLLFKPQFLITDWFPKASLTGIQLYQRLREAQPALHLSLLSFEVTPEHQFEAEAHGAHFLLKKPFTAEQLKTEMTRSLEALAKNSPGLHGQVRDTMRAAKPATRPVPPLIAPQPVIKPGDKVRYQGGVHVAQYVVHRHGETVVQLKGQNGFVSLEKLQPA
ncbi:CheY-like chemotaxis protein [Pelomonas saccharophila]|uniref:CheY-like chemotaxis protein n=1 Tax=Roseateles saccharophilus TaxID=304 RepID=A0ABU1YLA7_ROSSA|nr:response regulator [Roseateles saccharophilus]MDR7269642.1 CheY-like chemotaxis protein [Roseateles saccharophilus]